MSMLSRQFGRSRNGSVKAAAGSRRGAVRHAADRAADRAKAARPATVETMEGRTMMSVVPGYTETQYAGGGQVMRWISAQDWAPDGRLFIGEQFDSRFNAGVLRVVKNGVVNPEPVLTLPVSRGYERGLVGVLVDQNFQQNGWIYIYWTADQTPGREYAHNVISRFTIQGDKAVANSRVDILHQEGLGSAYHNGGAMHWGPDGKLYVGVGDNAVRATGQDLNTTKGKILRLNKDGTIPTDNPFYNQTTGINKSIWALGFRNPFTFSFTPSGSMYINDVGLDTWEEVNVGVKGGNYGWATIEGPRTNQTPPANYQNPIHAYKHPTGGFAAIAGSAFWNGKYYFGDYVSGEVMQLDPATNKVTKFAQVNQPVDIDVGPDGALYILSNGIDSKVFRYSPTTSAAPGITTQPESKSVAAGASATFSVAAFGTNLTYQWQKNGQPINGATNASYTVNAAALADNGAKYRVVVKNSAGQVTSNEATLTVADDSAPKPVILTPTLGTLWKGGQVLAFTGDATDAEDGTLPDSAFTWSVEYFTGTAQRPLYVQKSGIRGDSVELPAVTPYTGADVFARIVLTVTDSDGISTTVTRDVHPQKVNLSVGTNVAGLKFLLDGTEYTATKSAQAVVGVQRTIGAPASQVLNGVTYEFTGWSTGGAANQTIVTPATNTSYVANYRAVTTPGGGGGTTGNGLTGVYYNNNNFTGSSVTRVDQKVDFTWAASPVNGIEADTFSVRWTGKVLAPKTGNYRFYTNVDDGVRLWVNGKLIVSKWTNSSGAQTSAQIALTAGQRYDIKMEVYENTGNAKAQLAWTGPGIGWQVVPAANLFTTTTGSTPTPGGPVTLGAIADTYAHDAAPGTNFGNAAQLHAKNGSAGLNRKAYLKFDISSITKVNAAKLRLYGALNRAANNNAEKNVWVGVYGASDNWTESSVTWNAQPTISSRVGSGIIVDHNLRWYDFDISAYVKAAKAAGKTTISLAIQTAPTEVFALFNSSEAAGNRPQLVIS